MKKIIPILLTLIIAGCSTLSGQINSSTERTDGTQLQIHDIQGCSHKSPYDGKNVKSIRGVVTWKDEQGIFIQEMTPDKKDCSSEAIYVFTEHYPDAIPGDEVIVNGTVEEYVQKGQENALSTTEINATSVKILSAGNSLPDPVIIGTNGRKAPQNVIEDDSFSVFDPENDGLDFYESLEGMRVELDDAVVVGPENSYKEVVVIPGNTVPLNILSDQGALIADSHDQNPERITLVLPDGWSRLVNLGAKFTSPVVGVMDYQYQTYQVLITNNPSFQSGKQDVKSLEKTQSGRIRIATYNTENLEYLNFGRLDQLAKEIVNDLGSPDILVLEEICDDSGAVDDGTVTAGKTLKAIVKRVQENDGPEYYFVDFPPENNSSGGKTGENIRTAILYRQDHGLTMSDVDTEVLLPTRNTFDGSRIPSVLHFSAGDAGFYVIGVHLVSNLANTPEFGSIQPIEKPEEDKRIAQVRWIISLSEKLAKQDPNAAIFVAGDFNDTPESKSLAVFEEANFSNLAQGIPQKERYSILFDGNAVLYDQVVFKQGVSEKFTVDNAHIEHLNTYHAADKQSFDHDPFVIDISIK